MKSNLPFFAKDIFKDFDKFFFDFDDQVAKMQKLHDDITKNIPNYPPFNVRKIDDNHFTIEVAVAGFAQNEIDVEFDGGMLTIKGNSQSQETPEDYIFKGIGTRAFTRAWSLGDEYKVEGAELFNGILKVALERFVPEEKKPKKVPVKTKGQKQYLTEEDTRDVL